MRKLQLVFLLGVGATVAVGVFVLTQGDSAPAGTATALSVDREELTPGAIVVLPVAERITPPRPEFAGDGARGETRLIDRVFLTQDAEGTSHAFLDMSPFRGCRLVVISRDDAFDPSRLPAGFVQGFLDPCHGGVFSLDGSKLAGPGDRGLDVVPIVTAPNGGLALDFSSVTTTPG